MSAESAGYLAALGTYGFTAQEPAILAALVTGDPLFLIGRSGTGKTFLLNSMAVILMDIDQRLSDSKRWRPVLYCGMTRAVVRLDCWCTRVRRYGTDFLRN